MPERGNDTITLRFRGEMLRNGRLASFLKKVSAKGGFFLDFRKD